MSTTLRVDTQTWRPLHLKAAMEQSLFYTHLPLLTPFIEDPQVTEINITDTGWLYVERNGLKRRVAELELHPDKIKLFCRSVAVRQGGESLSLDKPVVQAALPEGYRIAIVGPPISINGYAVTIRKFRHTAYTLAELREFGMFPPEVQEILTNATMDPVNPKTILVSGATGAGKTTLLNALLLLAAQKDIRIGLIEDTPELKIGMFGNRFHFVAHGGHTVRELVRHALRQTPDRLIIGEVRGAEAFDLIDALNTGHAGSLSTVHASSAKGALLRLLLCASKAELTTPLSVPNLKAQIANAINYVVQLRRLEEKNGEGLRVVTEVIRVNGYNSLTDDYDLTFLYNYSPRVTTNLS